MQTIREGLYQILEQDHPQTIRGLFYQAVTRGLVPKTEAAYKNTVIRLMGDWLVGGPAVHFLEYDPWVGYFQLPQRTA